MEKGVYSGLIGKVGNCAPEIYKEFLVNILVWISLLCVIMW